MTHISIHRLFQILSATAALALAVPSPAQTPALQPRITSQIDNASRVALTGSQPPRARAEDDMGAVPATLPLHGISLFFSRSPAQQIALDALVAAQQDPASSLYHRWITPDQYAAQFGVADADLAAAKAWLEQQGFSVDSISRSHNRIVFSGTAAQVATAFGAPLHYYLTPSTAFEAAKTHFAPSADLTLPAALASSVLAVGNLSDFHLVPHILRSSPGAQPRFTSSQTGNHYLTPGDIATIYDITPAYNSGFTGSNQSIAVIGQSAVNLSDIANFQSAVGIAGKTPVTVLVPNSGSSEVYADGDEAESDLDLEYSSTIAKGAQVYFVYTGSSNSYGAFDAIVYAVDERVAPIISSSYGDCEPDLGSSGYSQYNASLEQAAAQGQTVVSAAGDNGSTDCYGDFKKNAAENEQLAVDFPGSSQYVTAVGGTEFPSADIASGNNTYFDTQSTADIVSSAKSYIPEMVWNDDVAESSLSAGGGGASIYTSQPSWQTGTIGGVAIASTGHRMVPDIALTASPVNAPFAFCTSDATFWSSSQKASCNDGLRDSSSQVLTTGGGTSFEAPTVSALVAIINQAKSSTGQGVINSTLYSIAATSAYATAFHDISSGGNQCLAGSSYCTSPGTTDYPATTGYDEASGLGSIDFDNLLNAWPNSGSSSLISTSTTLTAATTIPAAGATDAITVTVAPLATSASVPSGTVALSVDGGTATSLPLTAGVATYSFSSTTNGAHVLTATYSGDTTFASSTGSITLNVGGTITTSASFIVVASIPASVATGSSTAGTITITPNGGFTGSVSLTYSASTLTYGCVVIGSTPLSITGTTSATSTYTIYTSSTSCSAAAARPGSGSLSRNSTPTPPRQSPWKRLPIPASLAGAVLLLTLRRRSRRLGSKLLSASLAILLAATLSLSALSLTGCGSSSSTAAPVNITPAGTYTITFTATSGSTVISTNVTLTVT
jgi:hypothetical protein